jgi:hypothetical protein
MNTRTSLMPQKLQQHVLSLRVDDTLRRRLERARQLAASKTGGFVSTSAIAKQLLEAARDDRLEVVDLLEHPTDTLLQIRRKGEAGQVLSRAEWTTLAHFVRHGVEALSAQTPHAVSQESLVAVLDAFVAVYDARPTADSRLDPYYLGNLSPACRPASTPGDQTPPMSSEVVRRTLIEMRRHLIDQARTWVPTMLGRNLYVLLQDDELPGAEDLTRALRPYWSALWRVAARGHYVRIHAPVREPATARERLYRPPMPSLTEGAYTVSFAHGEGREFSVLLCFPGVRGPRYPIIGYPRLAEFRTMLADLVTGDSSDWTGTYFSAGVTSPPECREIWFRAHSNGVSFGFTVEEWRTVHTLFRRAWELPDIRVAWDALLREYGEW